MKIDLDEAIVCVLGLDYVGLPLAEDLRRQGNKISSYFHFSGFSIIYRLNSKVKPLFLFMTFL